MFRKYVANLLENPCRRAISIKLRSNFIEIALRRGCSPVNLLHISRTPFPRNTSGWLLLILNSSPGLFKYSSTNGIIGLSASSCSSVPSIDLLFLLFLVSSPSFTSSPVSLEVYKKKHSIAFRIIAFAQGIVFKFRFSNFASHTNISD